MAAFENFDRSFENTARTPGDVCKDFRQEGGGSETDEVIAAVKRRSDNGPVVLQGSKPIRDYLLRQVRDVTADQQGRIKAL